MPNRVYVESRVKEYMDSLKDPSHDWSHVQRVRSLALLIAQSEPSVDVELVEMAALMHDLGDAKYAKAEGEGESMIRSILTGLGWSEERILRLIEIVEHVSYTKECKRIAEGYVTHPEGREWACVQDADRLDAIGAMGAARCLVFSGCRNRPILGQGNTALLHFEEKLFKLKDMMKTERGKELAQQRHDFLLLFYHQIKREAELSGVI